LRNFTICVSALVKRYRESMTYGVSTDS